MWRKMSKKRRKNMNTEGETEKEKMGEEEKEKESKKKKKKIYDSFCRQNIEKILNSPLLLLTSNRPSPFSSTVSFLVI